MRRLLAQFEPFGWGLSYGVILATRQWLILGATVVGTVVVLALKVRNERRGPRGTL